MALIRLVVSDVDGTLVTPDKRLTLAAIVAVGELHARGIHFSIVSSRPPFGMRMLADPLSLRLPIGAFNGSAIVNSDLTLIENHPIPREAAEAALNLLAARGIDAWLFTTDSWLVQRVDGPYVDHEKRTIATEPQQTREIEPFLERISKIVGVSEDFNLLASCERDMKMVLGDRAHAARSQKYYLDVTPPGYDKGTFVEMLANRLNVPIDAVATIGDMQNDLPMFLRSGVSIAMGNAPDPVKTQAERVTASNEEDGFAKAVAQILDIT